MGWNFSPYNEINEIDVSMLDKNNTMIQLKSLSKSFLYKGQKTAVLKSVSLSIPKKSIYGIIGESGAGKSTLLRCLNGLETGDSGQVLFQGQDLMEASPEDLRQARHQMGMIFQHFQLLRRRTALENVMLPLEFTQQTRKEALEKAKECLRLVGLEGKAEAYPSQLSGGQAQRVAIARALVLETKVLLCDEPTSALDPKTSQEILSLLRGLNQDLGLTIVFITHDLSIVRDICTHVAVMEKGSLVESGEVETVFSSPQTSLTRSYVQSLFNARVPKIIEERLVKAPLSLSSEIVLRLIFSGRNSQKPVVSDLVQELGISVSIAGGALDHLGQATYGTLVITIPHEKETYHRVRSYLEARQIKVDLLGYIPLPKKH